VNPPTRVVIAATGFDSIPTYLGPLLPGASIEMAELSTLDQQVAEATALVPSGARISADLLAHAPRLQLVHQWGTGLENVDIPAATRLGIAVANTLTQDSGAAEAIAEWCVMMAIALCRDFPAVQANVRAGQPWGGPPGLTLFGQTAGIVGLGGIGQAVARHLRPFGMRLIGVKRTVPAGLAEELGLAWLGPMSELPTLLEQARLLFVCVPLNAETRDLLGERQLGLLPPGAFLINPARGPIVNRAALLQALEGGRLAGAALDVFWGEPPDPAEPLIHLPNVLVTPHVSGVTHLTYQNVARFVADNIRRVESGQYPLNCVNREVQLR
jgi:phosphoglycerate dehydrogenase-like enzyme